MNTEESPMTQDRALVNKYLKSPYNKICGEPFGNMFKENPWKVDVRLLDKASSEVRDIIGINTLTNKQIYLWRPYYMLMIGQLELIYNGKL